MDKTNKANKGKRVKKTGAVEIRPDLEDAEKGKDLSYLNEFPQFSTTEGVKAGVPPPREERNNS